MKRTKSAGGSAAILGGILDAILTLVESWMLVKTKQKKKLALTFSELTEDETSINKFIIFSETGNFLRSQDANNGS